MLIRACLTSVSVALFFAVAAAAQTFPAVNTPLAGSSLVSASTLAAAVQAVNVTTDANGAWSVTWAKSFVSAAPVVNPLPVNTGSLPILCNVATRSSAAAAGQCWQSTATTLPAVIATAAGLVLSPFGTPASNAAVMVIAREPTQ